MSQTEGRIDNQILDFKTYLRDFLWTKCPRTISCHKTMVAWFFLFQWGWNFNHFLWFWHLWCSFDWSFLINIFFILFWSNSFLWTWFWVSNRSFWNCGSFGSQFASQSCLFTCTSNILTAKSCPHKARVVPNRNVDSERHCCFEKWRQSGSIFLDCQS